MAIATTTTRTAATLSFCKWASRGSVRVEARAHDAEPRLRGKRNLSHAAGDATLFLGIRRSRRDGHADGLPFGDRRANVEAHLLRHAQPRARNSAKTGTGERSSGPTLSWRASASSRPLAMTPRGRPLGAWYATPSDAPLG